MSINGLFSKLKQENEELKHRLRQYDNQKEVTKEIRRLKWLIGKAMDASNYTEMRRVLKEGINEPYRR